jgi:putative OPT family oligopeptide transporter
MAQRSRSEAETSEATLPRRSLPPEAYEELPGDEVPRYVPADRQIPELTLKAVLIGIVLGMVFGAANAYLGLRVGLTVSASIPAAVMAVAIFRLLRSGTILETNIVQSVGSAGESLAAGVIFTIPALFVWGLEVSQLEVFTLAALGGLLGVLFMIPLRRFLISREHGKLPYPEGTACAEVQVAGQAGGSKAKLVFGGLGLGGVYKFLADSHAIQLWNESPQIQLPGKAAIGADATPELLGVGYIIGWRIALIMFSGGALAWLVIIPIINAVGGGQVIYPGEIPVAEMTSDEIWNSYIRYIGAGGVAYGGAITLLKSLPTIVESVKLGVGKIGEAAGETLRSIERTDRDLPLGWVGLGALAIAVLLDLIPFIPVNLLSALLMVIFAFFFVTVSSRIVGLIGSSSNPVSGMTIATLIATSLIFVALGMDEAADARISVLAVGAVVCIAAAIAGDTSQDLKTGFLVGATPWKQQVGEMVGVLTAATVMGAILILLHGSYGIGSETLPAPQATLMSLVIDGVLEANLPWTFVIIGIALAAIVEHALGLPSLAFAVGLYLPVSLTTPILVGGSLRKLTERRNSGEVLQEKREGGVLFGSGLIAGAALVGVLLAAVIFFAERVPLFQWLVDNWTIGYGWQGFLATPIAIVVFAGLAWTLYRRAEAAVGPDGGGA